MVIKNYQEELEIPDKVTVSYQHNVFSVKGSKGELKRMLRHPLITMKIEGKKIIFMVLHYTRREKMVLGSFMAHLKNMFQGVQEPYVYSLKVCSGHFPMNLTYAGNKLMVKNFIGEKVPRVLEVSKGVDVVVSGEVITVSSIDKELAGQTAASIERLCRRTGFDRRIFQQGIFITEKCGKPI